MNEKVKNFWRNHKDTIKNVVIVVTVTGTVLGIMVLKHVNELNKKIDELGLEDQFYPELKEWEEEEAKEENLVDDPELLELMQLEEEEARKEA